MTMSATAQRAAYRKLKAEALRARIAPGTIPRQEWATFRRSPDGQLALQRQARANGRASSQRSVAIAAYRREHPTATEADAIAWLERA